MIAIITCLVDVQIATRYGQTQGKTMFDHDKLIIINSTMRDQTMRTGTSKDTFERNYVQYYTNKKYIRYRTKQRQNAKKQKLFNLIEIIHRKIVCAN